MPTFMVKNTIRMRIRNLITSILWALPSLLLAQTVFDDFEGNGNINSWFGDDCVIETQLANPVAQGLNTSATVLHYQDQSGTWANVRFDVSDNFLFTQGHTFSVDVYVPSTGLTGNQPNQISMKLQDATQGQPWATQSEIIKPLVLDQWQTVTFDWVNDNFVNLDPTSAAPSTRTDFNRVLFQLNGENNSDQVVAYFDNVSYDGILDTAGNQPPIIFDQLVWADEFNGTGMIDTSKWYHQTQLPIPGSWYNGELQHYTDRVENSRVDSGFLYITAKNETFTDQGYTKQYTSARLNSKFAFTYGRIEVRAKLPMGAGTWPAIWTLGKNIDEFGAYWQPQFGNTPWPACGEMDIMEHWGVNQDHISSAVHTPSSFGGTVNTAGMNLPGVSDNFHVYALDWYPNRLDFSVDGNVFYTYEPEVYDASTWPFDADQYILLNIAINGDITSAFTESDMVIDHVRVYQQSSIGVEERGKTGSIKVYPNPAVNELYIEAGSRASGREAQIYNSVGAVIHEVQLGKEATRIDIQEWPAGVYFVRLEDNGNGALRILKAY